MKVTYDIYNIRPIIDRDIIYTCTMIVTYDIYNIRPIIDRDIIYTYNILLYIYIYTVYTVKIRNLKIVLLTSFIGRKCSVYVLHNFFYFNRPIIDRDIHIYYIQYYRIYIIYCIYGRN